MNHLGLIADNSRHVPDPGYRWSLAHDKCQRCHRAGAGVRTVGMRRPEVYYFTRLALCSACIDAGIVEGWPAVAGVPASREEPQDDQEALEALREEPPPSPRRPVTMARYPGRCPACGEAIGEGDPIALAGKKWHHARCAS